MKVLVLRIFARVCRTLGLFACSHTTQVFVMDTAEFPFFKAEVYHQFHNDMSEDYGRKYNNLRKQYVEDGKMEETGCPEKFL